MPDRAPRKSTPKPQGAAKPKRTDSRAPRRRGGGEAASAPRVTLPSDLVQTFGGDDRIALIRADLPPDATDGDLLRLLLEAQRLGADPTRRDLYLKRSFSRDGGGTGYDVVAKRDALLRHAERQHGFDHAEGAIFENDAFARVAPSGFADTLEGRAGVQHTAGHPKDRGPLWGAWCVVTVGGKEPILRVLSAENYIGTTAERAALDAEDPRRLHADQCMIAAAMSLTIRLACSLNDVIGADELAVPPSSVGLAPVTSDEDERTAHLTAKLGAVLRASALIDPLLWTPAKLRARLADESPEAVDRLVYEVGADLLPLLAKRLGELEAFDLTDMVEDDKIDVEREMEQVRESIAYFEHLTATAA